MQISTKFTTTFLIIGLCFLVLPLKGQQSWLVPADTLNKKRFWTCAAAGTVIYSGVAYGLYHTWYKGHDLSRFHTINDWGEWNQLDKMGHFLTAYSETRLLYGGARWTGLSKKRSLILSAALGNFLQATLETMDGFSTDWGFSWGDITFNALGVGAFVMQEAIWEDQRIIFKLSGNMANRRDDLIPSVSGTSFYSLADREAVIYGESIPERLLKDYNTMTIWASVNVHAFAPQNNWPKWLNIAFGHGSGNLYGGFDNSWEDEAGNEYRLPASDFPRYRQFYLSPDIDFTKIPTKKRWLKSVFSILNFLKFPAPTLELNTLGNIKFHPVYF